MPLVKRQGAVQWAAGLVFLGSLLVVHSPSSRMPAFQGRISDQDLFALGAFLASLK